LHRKLANCQWHSALLKARLNLYIVRSYSARRSAGLACKAFETSEAHLAFRSVLQDNGEARLRPDTGASMFKLSGATKLNEFEFDARSAKRASEVSAVLHARPAPSARSFGSIYISKFYSARPTPRRVKLSRQRIERKTLNDARARARA